MNYVIQRENLSNLTHQFDNADLFDKSASHVMYPFWTANHSKKTRKTFPCLFNSAKKTRTSENHEQKVLPFFPSDCVIDDFKRFVKILKQTINEYTKYSEVKNGKKRCFCMKNSSKNFLKRRKSLGLEQFVSPNELKRNKIRSFWSKIIYNRQLRKKLHFSTKLTKVLRDKRLFSCNYQNWLDKNQ